MWSPLQVLDLSPKISSKTKKKKHDLVQENNSATWDKLLHCSRNEQELAVWLDTYTFSYNLFGFLIIFIAFLIFAVTGSRTWALSVWSSTQSHQGP